MSSFAEIAREALQLIGAHSIASPADPKSITLAMKTANSMLQAWQTNNILLEITPVEVPGDELSEPLDARWAIISNLALLLAPNFNNGKTVVSPELIKSATEGMAFVKKHYQVLDRVNKQVSSTMPLGQGSMRGTRRQAFAGKGYIIGSN